MKKIFLGIFIAAVLFFTVCGIYYVASPLNSVDAVSETVEHSVNDKNAVIIRDEEVYYSEMDGTLYNHVSEGDRVAKDSLIGTVFEGRISEDSLKELRTIDKKIKHRREKLRESSLYTAEGADTESRIAGIIENITSAGENNDVAAISDYKEDLKNLRGGVEISDEEILNELLLEKEAAENRISANKSEIVTGMSGIFTTYIDGLESALNPKSMENYTLEYMRSLKVTDSVKLADKAVEKDGVVCKVVNNHIWYAALAVPSDEIEKHKVGDDVSLRFNLVSDETVEGTVYSISESDENGNRLVIVKCPSYFEGAFSCRSTDIDMIFESYTGFKVPVHAIRSDDSGRRYVVGMAGTKQYTCYCDILYTDTENEFIIIQSAEDSQAKLEHMESIVVGER